MSEIDVPTRRRNEALGLAAVQAGDPDYRGNDYVTSVVDTIVNVLLWLDAQGHRSEVDAAVETALIHYDAERT